MALPGKVTLATVRQTVRQRTEFTESDFVTDAELDGYINASYRALVDILVQRYGEDYFVSSDEFTTDGTSETYSLPDDFYKLLGVDVRVSGDTWLSLDRFEWAERNRFSASSAAAVAWRGNLRYRHQGDSLWLKPLAAAGQTVRLWYVPRPPQLSNAATVTCASVVAGDTLAFTFGDGSAARTLTAVNSGGGQWDFVRDASDTTTATNLATAINANTSTLNLTASSSGAVVTVTADAGPVIEWTASATMTLSEWNNVIDGVNGWEEFVVVDTVIKVKTKEESDYSAEALEKDRLIAQITSAATNRDAGKPKRVTDVYALDGEERV